MNGAAPPGRLGRRRAILLGLCFALAGWCGSSQAGVMRYCDPQAQHSAAQKDKLFRFAGIIKAELDKSGQSLALIARSGLDLRRFGYRYSHAGFSLKASRDTPWAVRQLYYACDEQKPQIYDQGMSAFVLGGDEPSLGYVSVVFVPLVEATELERAALDNRQALQMLGPTYSANAYPFSVLYQNCNQWVAELLAAAWGHLDDAGDPRAGAQRWLQQQGYRPSVFDVGQPLMSLGSFVPWLHSDDHPPADLGQKIYRVSMPASIEAFVQAAVPGATRIEFCHTEREVVIRRGWDSIAEGCRPGEQDTVVRLD